MPHEDDLSENGAWKGKRTNPDPGGIDFSLAHMEMVPDEPVQDRSGAEPSFEGLSDRVRALGEAYLEVVERHGEVEKSEAGYEPRSLRGTTCEGCVFYEGDQLGGNCKLVRGNVDAGAVCNLFISSNDQSNGERRRL